MTSVIKTDNISTVSGSGTLNVASGTTLYAPGHMIQYATAISTAVLDTQSGSYADLPGMTITFTPKSTSSHLFITVTNHIFKQQAAGWQAAGVQVYRDGVVRMAEGSYGQSANYNDSSTDRHMEYVTRHFFDAPNSTSALVYTVKGAKIQSAGDGVNMVFNNPSYGNGGRLTIMEIAQ